MNKRAVIYARVSTEAQERDGFGLPSQVEACQELAVAESYEVVATIRDEGYSGTTLNRPGLDEVLALIEKGACEVVVVHSPDRLSRDAAALLMLQREVTGKGVQLRFAKGQADDTPEGKLLFGIQALIADYERVQIIERTSRGQRQKARNGKIPRYSEPYGYRMITKHDAYSDPTLQEGTYLIEEPEAAIVREIFARTREGQSLRRIATWLNDDGIQTKFGKRWTATTVRFILGNSSYSGNAVFNRMKSNKTGNFNAKQRETRTNAERPESEWITIQIPAIISTEEFDAVNERLANNREKLMGRPSAITLIPGAVLRCGLCGSAYRKLTHTRSRTAYYTCRAAADKQFIGHRCSNKTRPAATLEGAIRQLMREVLTDRERIEAEVSARLTDSIVSVVQVKAALDAVRADTEELVIEESNLLNLAAKGAFSPESVEKALANLNTRRTQVRKREESLRAESENASESPEIPLSVDRFTTMVEARLNSGLTLTEERELVAHLIERIVCNSDGTCTVEVRVPLQNATSKSVKSTGVTYWEGAASVAGTLRWGAVSGEGYVELTGYGGTLSGKG